VAVIRGRVVDTAGEPVSLAAIYVVSAPVPQQDIAQLSADDGTFALSASAAGRYVIGARSDTAGDGTMTVTVTAVDQEVRGEITLTRRG
jgi:hypothetical protein